MKHACNTIIVIAVCLMIFSAAGLEAIEGVSPGAGDHSSLIESRCPTFSWEAAEGTAVYEIVAYVRDENVEAGVFELTEDFEVLYARIPGGATTWTPSSTQCLPAGGHYLWFVRPVTELSEDDQVIEAGEWSQGRYFEISAIPSKEELREAMEILRRWKGTRDEQGREPAVETLSDLPRASWRAGNSTRNHPTAGEKSIPTASAAIRGEDPDTSGEAYGVLGTSASAGGAGLAAANLGGGADLILDGSSDHVADTLISQSFLDRPSASDETFLIENSGAGAMDLQVDGGIHGGLVDVDEVRIKGTAVIDDHRHWTGSGDTVPCASCVTTSDVADGTLLEADLADNSVTSAKIADGSISSAEIHNASIAAVDLAVGAVDSASILDGSISGEDIGTAEVSTSHIMNFSITTEKLWTGAVTSSKIQDGTITSADVDQSTGFYVSKGQLYQGTESGVIPAYACLSVSASCNDANDLPMAGGYSIDPGGRLKVTAPMNWTDIGAVSGWTVEYCNDSDSSQDLDVYVVCISVD